ncbi:MAG: ATP-binding protein [Bacillota bacterium]|nr:ATP-binding protein [Bacillota bacterium]
MIKTIKGKISAVYLCLVAITGIIGLVSVINTYWIGRSIDGLMVNNYKSINAVNNMTEAVERQNNAVLIYINYSSSQGIDQFVKEGQEFNKWLNVEFNNLTEPGEKELVTKLNDNYINFTKLFSQIQQSRDLNGTAWADKFYNESTLPAFQNLKKSLNDILALNQTSMLQHKSDVTASANRSMYIIFIFSVISVTGGFILSRYAMNKSLKPIYSLRQTMKAVGEGDLTRRAEILSDDEIGELASEFNNLEEKLYEFEQSTMGQLLKEKNKSMTIVKSISDPLIVLDANYKIVLLNNAAEKLFNINEENTLNKHFLEAVRNGELYDFITKVYEGGSKTSSQEILNLPYDDNELFFNVTVTIVKDTKASMDGLVIVLQDITELKQVEKMKTDFISTISHELKTPLTSITMGISLLKDKNVGELNDKQKEVVDVISEEEQKLSDLIRNLLRMIKLQSKDSLLNMESTSILGVIDSTVRNYYEIAADKDVDLHYEVDEHIPKVIMDAEKISWVISNLLSNALKYTNAGDLIVVTSYIKDEKLYVSVKDTGLGIPEQYLERIFDKFVQVNHKNSDNSSSGLGLAVAREIIDLHGGTIWCESKIDVGSTFTFALPVR